jgi:hypothetical protein
MVMEKEKGDTTFMTRGELVSIIIGGEGARSRVVMVVGGGK